MEKILLIGPNRILNQAVSLYLFPNHDVQVRSNLEELDPKVFQDYNLIIVDSPAGADAKSATAVTRSIQELKTPTLWLEVKGSIPCPTREQILSIQMPIERGAFQKALDHLLSSASQNKKERNSLGLGVALKKATQNKGAKRRESKSLPENSQLIDLVDVVEEETKTAPGQKQLK